MTTSQARPALKALGTGVSVAVVAAGVALAGAPAASAVDASAMAPAAVVSQAHAASVPSGAVKAAAVKATVLRSAAPAGSVGQGGIGAGDCTVATGGSSTCDIYARAGSVTVHDSATTTKSIPVWSFSPSATAAVTAKSAVLVGTVGQPISITLHNTLAQNVGLAVPQVEGLAADRTGAATGAATTYTFTPTRAGTYIYEASLTNNGARQVMMGLAGALVVRPAAGATSAYDTAQGTFDDEAVVVYGAVDSHLAAAISAGQPFNQRDYNPDYHLVNGVAYPDTTEISTDLGRTLMLHVVNASILETSPTLLGANFSVIARGARPLGLDMAVSGRTVATGDTFDATVVPTEGGGARYSLYNNPTLDTRQSGLTNTGWLNGVNSPALGGALTFIKSGGSVGVTPTGPAVTALTVAGAPASTGSTPARVATATATLDTTGRGLGFVQDGEYFFDTSVAVGTGTPVTGLGGNATKVTVSFPVTTSALPSGNHTLYVRGRDASGAWGPVRSAVVRVDNSGPAVTGVVVDTPQVNAQDLTWSATVDETTQGASSSTAARSWVDGSATAPTAILPATTNGPRVIAAANGTVPAAVTATLAEGPHTLFLQGQDQWGQWGTAVGTTFLVDRTAPTTTAITLRPAATNGLSSNPAKPGSIGITADVLDPVAAGATSPVTMVEAYLTKVDPTGSVSGLQMVPAGPGATPGTTKYSADMPLAWVAGFKTNAIVPVFVLGMDAAGNRGPGLSTPLTIDKTVPTQTGVTATQGTGFPGDAAVALAAAADGTGSAVARTEYWIGTDPGAGLATAMTLTPGAGTAASAAASLNLNALGLVNGGPLTVYVRTLDLAGNASAVSAVTITLKPVTVFADGFETASAPFLPGAWDTQTSSGPGATLTTTATGALAGSRSMIAASPVAAPASISVARTAGTGSTTYFYRVAAVIGGVEQPTSPEASVAGQNATLSTTAYNTVSWTAVNGTTYRVYRSKTTGTEALVGSVTAASTSGSYADKGATATTALQSQTRTGFVQKNMTGVTPVIGATFSSHFTFAPGATATGSSTTSNVTVFSAQTANGANAVQVQYARVGSVVSFRVGVATGAANATPANQAITWSNWTTVTAATSYAVSVDLKAAATAALGGGAVLKVNSATTTVAVTGNTSAFTVASARLGVVSSTATTALSMLFDSYSSARVPF